MIELLLTYKYLIIFPLAVIEGPFLAVLIGYLVHMGYLNFFITFLVLLLADIGPDIFYYRIGKYGNKKILESKYFSNSARAANNLRILENMWHKHTKKTMFFAKLAYGISVPLIVSAGIAKLPLKKFILTSLPIGVFQISILFLIGYQLGASYELARQYIKYPGIIIAVLLLVVLILYVFFAKYFTKLFNKTVEI